MSRRHFYSSRRRKRWQNRRPKDLQKDWIFAEQAWTFAIWLVNAALRCAEGIRRCCTVHHAVGKCRRDAACRFRIFQNRRKKAERHFSGRKEVQKEIFFQFLPRRKLQKGRFLPKMEISNLRIFKNFRSAVFQFYGFLLVLSMCWSWKTWKRAFHGPQACRRNNSRLCAMASNFARIALLLLRCKIIPAKQNALKHAFK